VREADTQGSALPPTGFLREPQVLELIPISRSSWWAGVRAGRYPEPVRIGPRTTAWRAEDIYGLIAKLARGHIKDKPSTVDECGT
jgi:prophage regulatory protein